MPVCNAKFFFVLCIQLSKFLLQIRIIFTIFVAIGAKLNLKEKIFVSLSWMAKATVQVKYCYHYDLTQINFMFQ
jgi:hypothetical protein